jgi:carboxyl-terminal processing protease
MVLLPDITVNDTATPDDEFASLRETDLINSFTNPTGQQSTPLPPSPALPAIASSIPNKPPANWPAFDPTKPATDFQLQMGLKLLAGMGPGTTTASN